MSATEQAQAEALHDAVAGEGVPAPRAISIEEAAEEIKFRMEISEEERRLDRQHAAEAQAAEAQAETAEIPDIPPPEFVEHPNRPQLQQYARAAVAELLTVERLKAEAAALRQAGKTAQAATALQTALEKQQVAQNTIAQLDQVHHQMTQLEAAATREWHRVHLAAEDAKCTRAIPGFHDPAVRAQIIAQLRRDGYADQEIAGATDSRPIIAVARRLGLTSKQRGAPADVKARLRGKGFATTELERQIERGRIKPGSLEAAAARLAGHGDVSAKQQRQAAERRAARWNTPNQPGRPGRQSDMESIVARLARATSR